MLNSPFMQAGATKAVGKGLLRGGKLGFSGIVSNLEKTVSTINQVVPLYNQVKPLLSNSKIILNVFKNTKKDKNAQRQNRGYNNFQKQNFDPNIINVEVQQTPLTSPIPSSESNNNNIFTSIDTPNKPFFN